jgi:hypothetical protein
MNKKILWKIEELWNKNERSIFNNPNQHLNLQKLKIKNNYSDSGVSKYYPRFHLVNSFEFTQGIKNVFEDDYGSYKGLKKLQLIIKDKPIYLFDNHNEMIYPLVEIYESVPKSSLSVVHIDAHPDDALFHGEKPKLLTSIGTKNLISRTRISDFFDALSETKIINNIYRVTHSDSFEFFLPPDEPYILSLDIDIFGPEGNFVELKDKVSAIKKAWNGAAVVCIATSPGFIDQDFAREIIEIFRR